VIASVARRSRRHRRCDSCERWCIDAGTVYVSSVASPHHDDLGNPKWWRLDDCQECAMRHGTSHLIVEREQRSSG
jgi:hypothetical protein